MNNSKKTRKALLSSIVALMLCFSMFVGTTMAWFTDTATTSVNTIQAGTLDIDMVDVSGNSLVGTTLKFRDVNGSDDILWEPGATFKLDSFAVKNNGNLAAKYKIVVNGITGDAKLLEAIDFTVNNTTAVDDFTGNLKPNTTSDYYTLTAKMREEAGNEYQGLSLSGISITVVAGQDTVEVDSIDNQYDANATYGEYSYETKTVVVKTTEVTNADGSKTTEYRTAEAVTMSDGGATVKVPEGVKVEEGINTLGKHIEVVEEIQLPSGVTVASTETTEARTIEVPGVAVDNDKLIEVVLSDEEYRLPAGLTDVKAYSKGKELPRNAGTEESNGQYFTYDPATGIVTVYVKHFCNFTFVYKELPVAIFEEMTTLPIVDFEIDDETVSRTLNTAYTFTAVDDAATAATSKYAKWHADFVVSVDRDIPEGKEIGLAGQYASWSEDWLGFATKDGFTANTELRLLGEFGKMLNNGNPVYMNYAELCDYVKVFNCGAYGIDISGTTLTVELRLYETAEKTEENNSVNTETGRYVVVGTYSYTF